MRLVGYTVYLIGVFLIVGSATPYKAPKQYAATGGSRADGVINFSYDYSYREIPIVSEMQGKEQAVRRCEGWGYDGAEAFDEIRKYCIVSTSDSCIEWRVTLQYQCIKKDDTNHGFSQL